jgi:hypothetical protein
MTSKIKNLHMILNKKDLLHSWPLRHMHVTNFVYVPGIEFLLYELLISY